MVNAELINSYSILSDSRFVEWNENCWDLKSERRYFSDPKNRVVIEAVLYENNRGQYVQPPLTFYTAMHTSMPTINDLEPVQIESAWISALTQLTAELKRRGMSTGMNFLPGILDVRPLSWGGMMTEVRYTYTSRLPLQERPTHSVRKAINKASKQGLVIETTKDYRAIVDCLDDTGDRKKFSYRLRADTLASLASVLGPNLLTHVVLDDKGDVQAGGARLVSPNGTAIDWVQGTSRDALQKGAAQAIVDRVLSDAQVAGALSFDYGGANIQQVAKAKASWNMSLTPYYSVSQANIRSLYKVLKKMTKTA